MKRLLPLLLIAATFNSSSVFAGGVPVNDLCADAIPISCGQTIGGSNLGATNADVPGCGSSGPVGVWYTFYGDGSDVELSTCNGTTDFDTQIFVFSGSCGSLSCVGNNDDAAGGTCAFTLAGQNRFSILSIPTVCAVQYYVYVTGFNATDVGNFDLSLTCDGTAIMGDVLTQDLTVQLDATGNYTFPIGSTLPQTDAQQLVQAGSHTAGGFVYQSFTPTVDGVLQSISLSFTAVPAGAVDIVIRLGQGFGGSALGPATTITVSSTGLVEYPLFGTLEISAGTEYTIDVQPGLSPFNLAKNDGNPYAGGRNNTSATSDFVFSTKILQRPEIDNGSTSSVGLASFAVSQETFTCANIGPNTVTLTVTENGGATSTCASTLTVEDNIAPTAICQNVTVNLDASGNGSVTGAQVNNGSSDVCGIASTTLGTGGDFTIDNTLSSGGGVTLSAFILAFTPTYSATISSIELYDGGPSTGNLKLLDDTPCNSPVTLGTTNPTSYTGGWTTQTFNTPVSLTGGVTYYFQTNSGFVGGYFSSSDHPLTSVIHAPSSCASNANDFMFRVHMNDFGADDPMTFDCSDAGSTPGVTLQVVDNGGNTSYCTSTITVNDNTAPTAVCQPKTLVLNGSGSATLVVADVDNASSDNCGIATRTISKSSFNCGDVGTNTVMLTITDVNSLVSTCNATVTVEDNEFPALTCPADIELCSTNNSGSIVAYTEPLGTDNCGGSSTGPTDLSGLTNGSLFPIGTTVQTWTVTDASSNATSCSFNVTVNASPIADYTFSSACEGESVFFTDESTIDVTSSIVSWSWNMDDGSGLITLVDPSHVFADTGVYNVTLTVTSAESCTDDSTYAVHVTPVPTASFTFVEACEGDATVFTNTSTIDAGNLNYSWNFGDGSAPSTDADPSHVYALDGTYTATLTVTSDGGCEDVTTQSVNVNASPTALFTANTVCQGATTTFTNLSTGGGPLSYSWDFGYASATSILPNPTYTYATAGTYTVVLTVRNDNLCEDVHTVQVTVNALPTVVFSTDTVCEGTPTSFLNTSTAGTNTWDFGDLTSSTLANPSHTYSTFGTYNVTLTVTDANFCINSATQQVEVYDLPNFTLNATDVLCYGEETGVLVAVAVPPAADPWVMSIDDGLGPVTPSPNSVIFDDLAAGTYAITAVDTNGCAFTVSGTVNQPSDTLGLNLGTIDNILCHGNETGTIQVTGTGGTSPYMYSVDGNTAQPLGTFTLLEAGDHDIQITDFNLCVFDTIITLTEPDTLVLTPVATNNLLCNGDNSGNLTVLGTGGFAPYQYNINSGAYGSLAMFDGLAAGTHLVGVLDANGCSDTLHVTLTEPGILMLSLISRSDAQCFNALNGSIQVEASSGTAPYQYSLDGVSFQGPGLFQGLGAGTYTVTVKDANGCIDTHTESIFEPSQLTIETNSAPVSCFGENDGTIQIIAAGGTLAYSYSIDGGILFGTSASFTDLDGDNYLTIVRDANGCTASEGVIISEPSSPFILNANVTNVACLGGSSGSVLLVGSGGTPTYMYSEDNTSFQTSNVIGGFSTGNYTLYGQDLSGCVDSVQFFVGQPSTAVNINSTLLSNPACPNQASGAVTVLASGGTPGYMYSSNNGVTFQSSQILNGVSGGNHQIVVKDANGCTDTEIVSLVSPPILDIAIDTIINVDCEGNIDGEIHVVASGGTPSYSYRLNGGSLQTNGDFVNVSDGNYVIAITDVNGCVYSESFTVTAAQMQPVAGFGLTTSGQAVLFNNTSSFGDFYMWEFGDDSTSTEESPVHVYDESGVYSVTLTTTNECGSNSITINVSTTPTGIEANDAPSFGIYPNPTANELFLNSSKNIDETVGIEIVSVSGKLMRSEKLNSIQANNRIKINVNGLAQGVYFLRVVSQTNHAVLRFDIIK